MPQRGHFGMPHLQLRGETWRMCCFADKVEGGKGEREEMRFPVDLLACLQDAQVARRAWLWARAVVVELWFQSHGDWVARIVVGGEFVGGLGAEDVEVDGIAEFAGDGEECWLRFGRH